MLAQRKSKFYNFGTHTHTHKKKKKKKQFARPQKIAVSNDKK